MDGNDQKKISANQLCIGAPNFQIRSGATGRNCHTTYCSSLPAENNMRITLNDPIGSVKGGEYPVWKGK